MLNRLTAIIRQTGVRRAVSMLCAVALLVFSFAHATHFCGNTAAAPAQFEIATLDGSSDEADKVPAADHCCGCATVAMTLIETVLSHVEPAARLAAAAWQVPRPYIPQAEIRPPIV
jgi:hypothetical protein